MSPVVRGLLVLAALALCVGALRLAASFFVPLVFALFLVAVFWPVYRRVADRTRPGLGVAVALLLLVATLSVIFGGVALSAEAIVHDTGIPLAELRDRAMERLASLGLSEDKAKQALDSFAGAAGRWFIPGIAEAVAGVFLVFAFFGLAMLEVKRLAKRLERSTEAVRFRRIKALATAVATEFQRYVLVRTGIGLLTGVCTTLGCWAIGLEYALAWGMINFLLNYVPTIGSVVGVIPPVLFAALQEDEPGLAIAALLVVGGVQLVMGNWVDPLVQGKYMKLSPLVVLGAVTFWGFVWGPVGALIAVPLTVLMVLVSKHIPGMEWFSNILGEESNNESEATAQGSCERT